MEAAMEVEGMGRSTGMPLAAPHRDVHARTVTHSPICLLFMYIPVAESPDLSLLFERSIMQCECGGANVQPMLMLFVYTRV